MPRLVARISLALALAAGVACAAAGTSAGGAAAGPLVSSLQVETAGDSVRFVLQVTNASAAPARLEFPSGQSFDFVVERDGAELWRWSADRMFTQAVRSETLASGETRTYEAAWRPPAGVGGELVARGILTAGDARAEQQARFRLP
ncbi:MAG TPA: BsuPI-related putative proteinase inhibitor [Longimicrobiaceae bacterium]|nr:BsuPI-related putative proteinase inhibitor [Longimicrobiaceae bacterium]